MTADAAGHVWPPDDASRLTDAQKSLRAQMLATEHWSLLASRSTTQSEVLTRIAIFLTLVSAGLVTLGVLGNATQFRGWFGGAALGVLFLLVLLGLVTLLRVYNTATEDLMYVLAMNRLRGAYLDLDPGLERYFLMSADDDRPGAERTYHYFFSRGASQVFALDDDHHRRDRRGHRAVRRERGGRARRRGGGRAGAGDHRRGAAVRGLPGARVPPVSPVVRVARPASDDPARGARRGRVPDDAGRLTVQPPPPRGPTAPG
ncbi:hypothetical protein [Georgenia yuyongxinii]